jgi:divalent metal cation (Fe/Co/Zn/Cd) transporter
MTKCGEETSEPHSFVARLRIGRDEHSVVLEEHEHAHGRTQCDNNMRAAVIHVIADAAVSVMVIVGLLLARVFGWLWMDPLAGIVGACVIASWSFGCLAWSVIHRGYSAGHEPGSSHGGQPSTDDRG